MTNFAELRGPKVLLRAAVAADIDQLQALPLVPEIQRMYGVDAIAPGVRSREMAGRAIAGLRSEPNAWAIDAGAGYIGHIRLHSLVATDRRASLAIGIDDPTKLGQGLGPEAIQLVGGLAFGPMQLHRLRVRVLSINARATRAYEKCGFRREGVERETAYFEGRWHDDVIMGLLAHEFAG